MIDTRKELLDALAIAEALRPFVDPGDPRAVDFADAWSAALLRAKRAARAYADEEKKGSSPC